MSEDAVFARLVAPRRTWAIASIHGDADKLSRLHDALAGKLAVGDNLVYTGNILGFGAAPGDAIEEVLNFRRAFMARTRRDRPVEPGDIVLLRGAQEEMWHKLLQIQFAPNPADVLSWMLDNGIGPTIQAYGGSATQGLSAAREGVVTLTQWTNALRHNMRERDGHNALISALKRAAYTDDGDLLFVSAGVDPSRPLSEQSDFFWWGGKNFDQIQSPYGDFKRIIRGYARNPVGINVGAYTTTLDGNVRDSGSLIAACFNASGNLIDHIEV